MRVCACARLARKRSLDLLPLYDPCDDKSSAYAPAKTDARTSPAPRGDGRKAGLCSVHGVEAEHCAGCQHGWCVLCRGAASGRR